MAERSVEDRLTELERAFALLNDSVQGIRDDLDIAIKGARDRERSVEEALDKVQFSVSAVDRLSGDPELLHKLAEIAERIRLRGLQGMKEDAHAAMLLEEVHGSEQRIRDLAMRAEADNETLIGLIDLADTVRTSLQTAVDAANKLARPWWKRVWEGK